MFLFTVQHAMKISKGIVGVRRGGGGVGGGKLPLIQTQIILNIIPNFCQFDKIWHWKYSYFNSFLFHILRSGH